MEGEKLMCDLLRSLRKPQNGKRLLQVLVALRKEVNGPELKARIRLMDLGCLKQLVGYTQYETNPKVVDLALSVLGNCCMNTSVVRMTVNELNLLYNLHRVLEKHRRDSIRGRVFRILGNVCDGVAPAQVVEKEPAVVDDVVGFLKSFALEEDSDNEETLSVATVGMALRFVRKITVHATFNVLAREHKLISVVGMVLIKCTKNWMANKDEALINDVLKIMQNLSSSAYSHHDIILELRNTECGNAMESFGDLVLLQPAKVIKIVLKLARLSKYQSDLPTETMFTKLIGAVTSDNGAQNRQLLQCVAGLMDHVGFRDKLNGSGNVASLVGMLKSFDLRQEGDVLCAMHVCAVLLKCRYNSTLISLQMSSDVVPAIVDKLEALSGKSTGKVEVVAHKGAHSRTDYRSAKRLKTEEPTRFPEMPVWVYNTIRPTERCASPSSCSDTSSCGPFSPSASRNNLCYDSDSDNYSPLCSEDECEDKLDGSPEDFAKDDAALSGSEDNRLSSDSMPSNLRSQLKSELYRLLNLYTVNFPTNPQLNNPRLLTLLSNIVLDSKTSEEQCEELLRIIKSIIQSFLPSLMLTDVVPPIYDAMKSKYSDSCMECDLVRGKVEKLLSYFTTTYEDGCVKGEILYMLNKGREDVRRSFALTLPYIVREVKMLSKLLKDCGALIILIDLLKDSGNAKLQEKSLKTICVMATDSLKIKSPVYKGGRTRRPGSPSIRVGGYTLPPSCENVVSFKLDDGSRVFADRDVLAGKSDYFAVLFNGRFLESESNEVVLKDVAEKTLRCVLRLLSGDIDKSTRLTFDCDVETILDVISLTDRFLLNDLCYLVTCHAEQLIGSDTVPAVYKWAIESGTNILRVESVAFALVGDITYKERLNLFHTLFGLGYLMELADDVEKLVRQFLER